MGSGMISLFFLVIFILDYGANTKLRDENYNKPGAYNCLNGGKYLGLPMSVLFLSKDCNPNTQVPVRMVSERTPLKQDVKRNWKSQVLLDKLLGDQQQARYFSRMGKRPLSTKKYKHFRVMKKVTERF
jgi:hypothetical protein